MSKTTFIRDLQDKFILYFGRSILLYIAVAVVVFWGVRQDRLAFTTMDYLSSVPAFIQEYANQGIASSLSAPSELQTSRLYQSIRYYKNVLKVFPDSAVFHSIIGYCYYYLGNHQKAIDYYQRAIRLDRNLFGLYYNLGLIYFQDRDFPAAIENFQKAIKTTPVNTVLFRGIVMDPFYNQANYDHSENAGSRNASLKEGYDQCYKLMILSFDELKDYQSLKEVAAYSLTRINSEQEFYSFYAGKASFYLGDYRNSYALLNAAVVKDPGYVDAYELMAQSIEKSDLNKNSKESQERIKLLRSKREGKLQKETVVSKVLYFYFFDIRNLM